MWGYAWRDVRWKVALMALVNAAISVLLLDDVVSGGVWVRRLSGSLPMLFAMNAVVLASAGVATQISQRPGQVVHSSMLFLLSLPISRRRLVLVREAVGALGAIALLLATLGAYWCFAEPLRAVLPAAVAWRYVVSVAAATLTAYSLSSLFSTFLDQLWQTYAALGVVSLLLFAIPTTRIWREAFDATHQTLLIGGVSACLVVSALLIWLSVRAVERKQF